MVDFLRHTFVAHVDAGRDFRHGIEGQDFDRPDIQLQEVIQAFNFCRQNLLAEAVGRAALFVWYGPDRLFPADNIGNDGLEKRSPIHLSAL